MKAASQSVCKTCQETSHENHTFADLTTKAQTTKDRLQLIEEQAVDYVRDADRALEEIKESEDDFSRKCEEVKCKINDTYSKLIAILKERQDLSLKELFEIEKDVGNRLRRETEKAMVHRACTEDLQVVANILLEFGCDSEIVDMENEVQTKLKRVQDRKISQLYGFQFGLFFDTKDEIAFKLRTFGRLKLKQFVSLVSVTGTKIRKGRITNMNSRTGLIALCNEETTNNCCCGGVKVFGSNNELLYEDKAESASSPIHNGIAIKEDGNIITVFRCSGKVEQRSTGGTLLGSWESENMRKCIFTTNLEQIVALNLDSGSLLWYSLDGTLERQVRIKLDGRPLKIVVTDDDKIVILHSDRNRVKCSTLGVDGELNVRNYDECDDSSASVDACENFIGKDKTGLMVLIPANVAIPRQERVHLDSIGMEQVRDLSEISAAEDGQIVAVFSEHTKGGSCPSSILSLRYLP